MQRGCLDFKQSQESEAVTLSGEGITSGHTFDYEFEDLEQGRIALLGRCSPLGSELPNARL